MLQGSEMQTETAEFENVNWFAQYFRPDGEASKPVFLRGQTILIFFRLIIFGLCIGMSFVAPSIAIPVWIVAMLIQLGMSLVLHIRRLNHAARSALWAVVIAIPLMLSGVSLIMGVTSVPVQLEKIAEKKAAAEEAKAKRREAKERGEEVSEEAGAPADAAPRRKGKPKEITQKSLLSGVLSQSMFLWFLVSSFFSLYSFMFVARVQRKDDDARNF